QAPFWHFVMTSLLGYQYGHHIGIMIRLCPAAVSERSRNMAKTLFEKVFERHVVRPMSGAQCQLFIGLHLIHEGSSPPAFQELRERGLSVRHPERTFATQDHANPTTSLMRPYADSENEGQVQALERNVEAFGIRYFSPERGEHGIVHVIGPELGLTQPGM